VFVVIIVLLVMLLLLQERARWAHEVSLGGRPIVLAATGDDAERIVEQVERELVPDIPEEASYNPEFKITRLPRGDRIVLPFDEALRQFKRAARIYAPAAALMVNGKMVVTLRSVKDAAECMRRVQRAYGPGRTRVKERWEVLETRAESRKRLAVERAKEFLVTPREVQTYRVRPGETAWTIARSQGLSMRGLERANPGLDMAALRPGTIIRIGAGSLPITVMTVRKETRVEMVPYETQTVTDPDLRPGARRIIRPGQAGERQVIEEVTLENGKELERRLIKIQISRPPVAERLAVGR
jgi:hypothetical protein